MGVPFVPFCVKNIAVSGFWTHPVRLVGPVLLLLSYLLPVLPSVPLPLPLFPRRSPLAVGKMIDGGGVRTRYFWIATPVLYPLSYSACWMNIVRLSIPKTSGICRVKMTDGGGVRTRFF